MVVWHKINIILIFLFSVMWSFVANAEIYAYFTPSFDCENNIIKLIDKAQSSVDIAVYALNNRDIVEALKRAKKRKINIRILTDRLQASNKYSLVPELFISGFDLKVHNKFKIEHNKFAVFDNSSLVTGSFNWTEAASKKNSENCLFMINEPKIVLQYIQRFNQLWQLNNKQKSNHWLLQRIAR